jgi:hypothetical protein
MCVVVVRKLCHCQDVVPVVLPLVGEVPKVLFNRLVGDF